MSQLRIFLTHEWQDASSACEWVVVDDALSILQSGRSNLASMPKADDCIAIVAAQLVLCIAHTLPKIKPSQLETALPLALEDKMLGDVGDQHVLPGAQTAEGKTLLYAMDKLYLRRFVDACAVAGQRLHRVVPEYCLLPAQRDEWALMWDGQQGWLAQDKYQGLALGQGDVRNAPAALPLLWQMATTQPRSIRVHYALTSSDAQRVLPSWNGLPLVQGSELFDWRNARVTEAMPNLLWGKFAPAMRVHEWLPKIRPLLWILLLGLTIEALGYNALWWSLAHEKSQTLKAMDTVFQETFGQEVAVVDASLQMRRSLARARHAAGVTDDADLLPLLDRVSAELAAQVGSQVTALRYAEGLLDIDLKMLSRSALEAFQMSLSQQGLSVHVLEINEGGAGVEAHLRVASGGGR